MSREPHQVPAKCRQTLAWLSINNGPGLLQVVATAARLQ
jgi:hypothetical protein